MPEHIVYQLFCLSFLIVFYCCYFWKMFSQKKRGIQTDQIGKGKKGIALAIEVVLKITTLLMPFAELVSILFVKTKLPAVLRAAGCVLGSVGIFVFISAVLTMRDSWRAGVSETDKTELVTQGIFGFSRNPAFLGFDLVYLGILLAVFNWWLMAITLTAMLMLHLQIVMVEEPFLKKAFGEDYSRYMSRVRRYLGKKKQV